MEFLSSVAGVTVVLAVALVPFVFSLMLVLRIWGMSDQLRELIAQGKTAAEDRLVMRKALQEIVARRPAGHGESVPARTQTVPR